MPIDKSRYPNNWDAKALSIKQQANWCCTRCGKPCRKPGENILKFQCRLPAFWRKVYVKPGQFVLTVAHKDQNPANNDLSNLAALCSVCHLKHDAPFRKQNRQAKLERNGQCSI